MRAMAWLAGLLAAGLLAPPAVQAAGPVFPVIDLHVDLPWHLHYRGRSLALDRGMVTAKTLASGHVEGVVLPFYLPPEKMPAGGPNPAELEAVYATVEKLVLRPGSPFQPLPQAEQGRQVRGWLAFEGAQALAADPTAITGWVQRGVRLVGLTHTKDNDLAGSSTGTKRKGLTEAGKIMARKAIEAGALLDVSHLSDASFDDVAALSKELGVPFVASHSNARALCKQPRNLTDAQLRTLGESGGVVGLNLHAPYLSDDPEPGLAQAVAQAEHLLRVAGEDHVAIGSDFDGGIVAPRDLPDAGAFPVLAQALLRRGHPEEQVRKMFAGNARRVLGFTRPTAAR